MSEVKYVFDTPNMSINATLNTLPKEYVMLGWNEAETKNWIYSSFTKDDLVRLKTAIEDLIHEFP